MKPSIATPLRVLIADTSEVYINALESFLKTNQNITVIGFCNSSDYLMEKLKTSGLDVLIIDTIIFKDNSAVEIQKIKSQYPNIKIIVLSLQDGSNMREEMIKAGAHEHISKWDDVKKLISIVNYN
jgi:DNA-binding NarL/FixJ family response regulator